MGIGEKIKQLRLKRGLTQEELANRAELSKGFISQVERDLTSPSIATLMDILECLGTNVKDFFSESVDEKIVYTPADIFVKEDGELGSRIEWLVTSAQKNQLEPILLTLQPGGYSYLDDPHEGEEFGYVLSGSVHLLLGDQHYIVRKGDSFYIRPSLPHQLRNMSKSKARVLWVSTPPSF
ncbi:MAG: helix-turn-helix domain-containing protein [Christensenellales bacterium]|jgi:transcriptional regulator with XRE-family HTH domain